MKLEDKEIIETLALAISSRYNISLEELKCGSRYDEFVMPRHIAIALSWVLTKNNQTKIGSYFGGRNHSTVNHSRRKMIDFCQTDKQFYDTAKEALAYVNIQLGTRFDLRKIITNKPRVDKYPPENYISLFHETIKEIIDCKDQSETLALVEALRGINKAIMLNEKTNQN